MSITQLDPLACEDCLTKLKGGKSAKRSDEITGGSSNLSAVPDMLKIAGGALIGLLVGLAIGFGIGRMTAPRGDSSNTSSQSTERSRREYQKTSPITRSNRDSNDRDLETRSSTDEKSASQSNSPDESTKPGPGYRWVNEYTRKDGSKVKGHWAKDTKRQ
ncbi:MAG: hypothetical protein FJ267_05775 [Planctomycetes bacterium]|nr:hypothetical protein [Planctomycetota bacterium]